jgi:hypothetical protein
MSESPIVSLVESVTFINGVATIAWKLSESCFRMAPYGAGKLPKNGRHHASL